MIQFQMTRFADGKSVVTAYVDGEMYSITDERPQFEAILNKLRQGDESVVVDFDAANFANKAFHKVTDRVNIKNGVIYLDDEPVDNTMAQVIMDYLAEGNENALPLVRFMERLSENPSHRSREQFWRFVDRNGIYIDDDGYAILYKGVYETGEAGLYQSGSRGRAFVNGAEQNGRIQTRVGDVVTMPRREISDDPTVACHAGLHCGDRSYAESFAPVLITVRVDPAHVVSVPVDSADRKVRVERYEIMDVVKSQVNTVRWGESMTVLVDSDEDYEDDEDYDDYGW